MHFLSKLNVKGYNLQIVSLVTVKNYPKILLVVLRVKNTTSKVTWTHEILTTSQEQVYKGKEKQSNYKKQEEIKLFTKKEDLRSTIY